MRCVVALLLAFVVAPAFGLDIPRGSAADARVKRVAYNEHDVVAVYSYNGAATQVVFAPGEQVLDIASGFGDGWEVEDRRNFIYIKPKSVRATAEDGTEAVVAPVPGEWDTNLIVVTDQRSYLFQLFLIGAPGKGSALEYDPRTAFRIQFTYPQVEAARAAATESKRVTETRLSASNAVRNINYTMKVGRNSDAIAPVGAYDDGRFTYLTFPANREIPAVFLVGEDKQESAVNTHMSGETLVVQRVAPRLVLRLGKQAVSIFNEGYDGVGVSAIAGTTVPGVDRVLTVTDQGDAPAAAPMEALAQRTVDMANALPAPGTPERAPYTPFGASSPVPALSPAAQAVAPSPPPAKPKYVGLDKAPVQATLRTWMPADWTLAWDTKADPRGVAVESNGEFLDAVRALFSTRKDWSVQLEAQAFPNERILQVRDAVTPAPAPLTAEPLVHQ